MPFPAPSHRRRIDLRGYRCPIPVIRLETALRGLPKDTQVIVFVDDPVAAIDIPHFCHEAGHHVDRLEDCDNACVFCVTKAPESTPE